MPGIEEAAPRSIASRTGRRLLVLDPARRNLGIDPLLLTPGEHVIGSAADASVRLTAAGIAPRHCVVRVDGHHATVTACDRRTWHNNGPFSEARLRVGDKLAIGPIEFRIGELAAAPDASQEPEAPMPAGVDTTPKSRRPVSETTRARHSNRAAPEVESDVHNRLLAASRLVDDLLREERGGAPAQAFPSDREPSPAERGEFVLKLLDQLHEKASALLERERRYTAAHREFETERRELGALRETLHREQAELAASRDAMERSKHELDAERTSLQERRNRLEPEARTSFDRLREVEAALARLQSEQAQFEETRRSHEEAVLGLESELQQRCNDCVETEKRLSEERSRLDGEYQKLDRERDRCDAVRRELEEGDAQLEAVAIEVERRAVEIRQRSEDLDRAANEIERRRESLEEAERSLEQRMSAAVCRESDAERREAELLRRERDAEAHGQGAPQAPPEPAAASNTLAQELDAIARQREELQDLWTVLDSGLQGLIERRREVESLQQTLAEAQGQAHARSEEHAAGLRAIADQRTVLEAERSRLDGEQHRLEALSASLANAAQSAADAGSAAIALDDAARDDLEEAWQWVQDETWRLIEEDQRLHAEADRLRAESDEAADRAADREQLHNSLAKAEIALAGWETSLEDAVADLDERRTHLGVSERSLAEQIQEHEQKSRAFNEAALRLASHELAQQEKARELRQREAELAARGDDLEARAQQTEAIAAEQARLDARIAELDCKKQRLDAQGAALDREKEQLAGERAGLDARMLACEERETRVDRLEQRAESVVSEQARLEEHLARIHEETAAIEREKQQLDHERADLSGRALESEEREAVLAERERDLSEARSTLETERAEFLEERARLHVPVEQPPLMAVAAIPSAESPAPRPFDSMPAFFPTPEPFAAPHGGQAPQERSSSLGLAQDATVVEEPADSAAPAAEAGTDEPQNPAASEFRLLDLAWFAEKSRPPSDVGDSASEHSDRDLPQEHRLVADRDADNHPLLGEPCLRPGADFSPRSLGDDDRVAAFWRSTDVEARKTVEPEQASRADVSEPEDDRARDVRSALAAMFDLPSDLAHRRTDDETGREESAAAEGDSAALPKLDSFATPDEDQGPLAGSSSPIDFSRLLAPAPTPAPEPVREPERQAHRPPAAREHGSAVHDIEDSDSVAAYMERLFARTRGGEEVYDAPKPEAPKPVMPPPAAPAPRRSSSEIIVPAYVPGMEAPVEELFEVQPEVDPVHRQDKNAVRASMDSLREMANISARSAIARHSWKQFRTVVWVKAALLVGSTAMSICLLSERLFGKLGLKFAGWSLAGIALVVAANLAHTCWTLSRAEKAGERPEAEEVEPIGAMNNEPDFSTKDA